MADNIQLPGTGLDVATDEIASKHYQRVKLIQGADGTNDGDVSSAAPLQVTLANGSVPSHAVTNAGTFATQAAQSGTWTVQPGNTANTTAWKVDGSAVTQPVSGTVTANLSATDNAVLDNIDADTSAIQTAVELIDDAVYTDDADWTALTSKHQLVGGVYTSVARTITDGDTGALAVDVNGHLIMMQQADALVFGDASSNTRQTPVDEADAKIVYKTYPSFFNGTTWDRIRGDATNGLLVNLGTNNDVTVTGSVTANAGTNLNTSALALETGGNLAGAATSLALLDDAIVADDAAFTPATTKVMVAGFEYDDTLPDSVDEGDAGAARMSANRNQYVQIRDNAGNERGLNIDASGQLAVTLAAGQTLATVTTVAAVTAISNALPAGTNNIGDVDVLSIAAGDNNIGNVDIVTVPAPLSTTGGGTEAAALRVTLASDSTGLVSVDDNGGSLTVDGTVSVSGAVDTELTTADLDTGAGTDTRAVVGLVYGASGGGVLVSTTNPLPIADNSGSLTVDAPVGTPVFVRLSDGAAAISTLPVSLASVPSHAVTNAGTFATQVDGSALTALQLIDDSIFADDAAFTLASSKVTVAGGIRDDALTTLTAVEGDAVPLRVSSTGALHVTGGGGGTEYTEDVAAAADPVGNALIVVRDDARGGSLTTLDGDNVALRGTNAGELYVKHVDAVPVTDNSGSLTVDYATTGSGTATGALRVELPTNGTGVIATVSAVTAITNALPAGTNAIGKLAANSGVDIGDVDVTSISAGANLIGDVGISGARTSGGTTLYKNIDVDETEDQVKATAGQVYWIHAINVATTIRYLKFYNATAANVTVGTTAPDLTFPVPSAGAATGAGFALAIPNGIAFSTAITIAATTGVADADTGAPGANDVIVNLGYA